MRSSLKGGAFVCFVTGVCRDGSDDNSGGRRSGSAHPRLHHILPVLARNAPSRLQPVKHKTGRAGNSCVQEISVVLGEFSR